MRVAVTPGGDKGEGAGEPELRTAAPALIAAVVQSDMARSWWRTDPTCPRQAPRPVMVVSSSVYRRLSPTDGKHFRAKRYGFCEQPFASVEDA